MGAGAGTGNGQGIEVLLPIRIDRAGKSRITSVTITYRVGGKRYELEDPTDVVACTYACEARPGGRRTPMRRPRLRISVR
jgi:hypothetical protein